MTTTGIFNWLNIQLKTLTAVVWLASKVDLFFEDLSISSLTFFSCGAFSVIGNFAALTFICPTIFSDLVGKGSLGV